MRTTVAGLVLLITFAGCGSDDTLNGIRREVLLEVAHVTLPDVSDPSVRGGGIVEDEQLVMRAREGRLLVTYFGFLNCPDVCPTTLADLRSALSQLDAADRERVDVVFVTVDPDRDGPAELAAYLQHFTPRYHALRAAGGQLDAALEAFLASATVTTDADGSIEVAHTGVLYAVDARGQVVVEWPFGTSAPAIAQDLSLLLTRAASGGS